MTQICGRASIAINPSLGVGAIRTSSAGVTPRRNAIVAHASASSAEHPPVRHVCRERGAHDQRSEQSADSEQDVQVVERRGKPLPIELDDQCIGADVDAAIGEAEQKSRAQQSRKPRRRSEPSQSCREERHRADQDLLRAQLLIDLAGDQHRYERTGRRSADDQSDALDRQMGGVRDLRQKGSNPAAVDAHHQHARVREPRDGSLAAQQPRIVQCPDARSHDATERITR